MEKKPTRVFAVDHDMFREEAIRLLMKRRERLMLSNFGALSPRIREELLKKFPEMPRPVATKLLFDMAVEKSLASQDPKESNSADAELFRQYRTMVGRGVKSPERVIATRVSIGPQELMARLQAYSMHPTEEVETRRGPVTLIKGGFVGPAKRKFPNRRRKT